MDSLFGFGVELDLASSSWLSSVATEISSSLNFRIFVLPGDGFLLALPTDDGEFGDGEDDAALAPPPLGLRLATTRAGEVKGAAVLT